jgi:Ser/Thr protein kinase RdoA (MazF antagonist)
MDYAYLSYEKLAALRQLLEELVQQEGMERDEGAHLNAVKQEMEMRRFRLVGKSDGQTVREYGRWRTREQCEQQAQQLGLPLGRYQLRDQPFEIAVAEVP